MKIAVVYFSLEGNTKYIAENIGKELDADIIQLIPDNAYPTGKVSKFFWGGKSSVFKEKPELQSYDFNQANYDYIIIGTPLWASTFVPPIRSFLVDNKLEDKNIGFFVSCSGGNTDKCFKELEAETNNCNIIATLRLVDPYKKKNEENNTKILEFCSKFKNVIKK